MAEPNQQQINAESLSADDVSLIQRFKNKAGEFVNAMTALNTMQDIPPNLQNEYDDLQQRGGAIQWTITQLTETVDNVTGWISDVFNFDGVASVRDYINNDSPNDLGFAPLIPAAAITAALAVMGKFITDVYLFERKVNEHKRLVATGMPEDEAATIVDKMTGRGITANLADIAKPVGFALAAFFILRMMRRGDV